MVLDERLLLLPPPLRLRLMIASSTPSRSASSEALRGTPMSDIEPRGFADSHSFAPHASGETMTTFLKSVRLPLIQSLKRAVIDKLYVGTSKDPKKRFEHESTSLVAGA